MPALGEKVRQRADYTQKFNALNGRHGWLRLTPAYSVKIVEEIVSHYDKSVSILDPFCGTGTTALCAVGRGNPATTVDVNPFLAWLARAKTASYSPSALISASKAAQCAFDITRSRAVAPAPCPPIHHVERWWPQGNLELLRYLKSAISEVSADDDQVADLLHIAFCRTLIKLSNAAFNHQSLSFQEDGEGTQPALLLASEETFLDDASYVIGTAALNPVGAGSVIQGDAKDLHPELHGVHDVVITSPPYANRISYIRELRPYMYWLRYLSTGRAAGDLDWQTIGGTWGVATSRLMDWSPCGNWWLPDELDPVVSAISDANDVNGQLLSNYVRRYFTDISQHLSNLRSVLNSGAEVHYIIGNSSFYGVLVPTEKFYADLMREYGFANVTVRTIRKRNSKRELFEFAVSAQWP